MARDDSGCIHHGVINKELEYIKEKIMKGEQDMLRMDKRLDEVDAFCARIETSWRTAYVTLAIVASASSFIGTLAIKYL